MIASVYNKFFELLVINDTDALIGEYRSRSMLLGKEVLVYGTNQSALPENGGQGIRAMAIDIDRNAGLVVEYQEGPFSGQRETLTSGEVTIKKI